MVKSVFIVGCQRSGTTWLSNLLLESNYISAIHHQKHRGIHESAIFSNVIEYFGDINDINNYIIFLNAFFVSDYFKISNIDKGIFYKKKFKSYYQFFKYFMDIYANSKNNQIWIEKTPAHTLYIESILKNIPSSKIICVKRNIVDNVKSFLRRSYFDNNLKRINQKSKLRLITEHSIHIKIYNAHIDYMKKKFNDKILIINYNDLKNDKDNTLKQICKYINIKYEKKMLFSRYKPNTSFKKMDERNKIINRSEMNYIKIISKIFNIIPNNIIIKLYKRYTKKQKTIPDWFFSFYKEEMVL